MQIAFDFSRDDFWRFLRPFVWWHRPRAVAQVAVGPLAVALIAQLAGFWIVSVVGGLAVGFALALVAGVMQRRRINRLVTDGRGVIGRHTLRVDAEGVRDTTDVIDTLVPWRAIRSVDVRDGLVVLSIDVACAVVVPVRALQGSDELDRFVGLVDSHRGAVAA